MAQEQQQHGRTMARNERETRSMGVVLARAESEDGESRRLTLSFSSEEPYLRTFGPEILDHGEGAVDLARLNEVGVLLFNHDTDRVIGKVLRAWVEDGRGVAEVEFDSDEASETIFGKVQSGTLKATSVCYSIDQWEDVARGAVSQDGRFNGPCKVARKWTPLEVSIVSIPADPTVGVGRSMDSESDLGLAVFEKQIIINQNRG